MPDQHQGPFLAQPLEGFAPAMPGFAMPGNTTVATLDQTQGVHPHPTPAPPPPPPPMPPEIARAIVEVCKAVKRLRLDGQNTSPNGQYRFTSIDEFLEVVGAWCADADLFIIPQEVSATIRDGGPKYDNRGNYTGQKQVLVAVYQFWLGHASGAMWLYPLTRRVALAATGPQAFGAAESYVLKRFLRALFKVPSGDSLEPGSDVWDPDGAAQVQQAAAPPQAAQASPAGGSDLWGAPTNQDPRAGLWGQEQPKPALARVTGRVAPPRGAQGYGGGPNPGHAGPVLEHQPQPPAPTEPPGPVRGESPFRIRNGLGEVVAEFRDLKTWGEGLKRHLARFPSAFPVNLPEVERLADHFLSDPALSDKARKGMEAAFQGLRALDPALAQGEAQASADTGTPLHTMLDAVRTGAPPLGDTTTTDAHPLAQREPGEEG